MHRRRIRRIRRVVIVTCVTVIVRVRPSSFFGRRFDGFDREAGKRVFNPPPIMPSRRRRFTRAFPDPPADDGGGNGVQVGFHHLEFILSMSYFIMPSRAAVAAASGCGKEERKIFQSYLYN